MILQSALIAEKTQGPRSVLAELLREAGFSIVAEAASRDDALKQMLMIAYDVLFLEVTSPKDAGFRLVREVRTSRKLNHRLPVVMVSADTQIGTVTKVRDRGANAFIAKPLTRAGVLLQIMRVRNDSRAFIEADTFAGPDRRRWADLACREPERRGASESVFIA